MMEVVTRTQEETAELGRSFATTLKGGDVVALRGDLGTGKTTFVTGVCGALAPGVHVSSPTFTLVNEYRAQRCTVVHIDLYRLESIGEVAELGLDEYFSEANICLIEWPELVLDIMPVGFVSVQFKYGTGDEERRITIEKSERAVPAGGAGAGKTAGHPGRRSK